MTTASEQYARNPITPVGTERIWADLASGATGGMLSQAIADLFKGTKGVDVPSGATVNLGAASGMYVHITGTTAITAFDNVAAGILRHVLFLGALVLTYNATSLITPTGANITTAAGDTATLISEGAGNWRVLGYQRASGAPLALGTAAADFDLGGHKLVNVADPSAPTDGVNLETLQSYLAKLDSKGACAYGSTSPLPANTYSNGSSGVGATLTGTANGPLDIDGVTMGSGDVGRRFLVGGEAATEHNGWYTLTQLGVTSVSPYILTRAVDSDQASEIAPGYITAVSAPSGSTPGTTNDGIVFLSLCPVPFVVGTDGLAFAPVGTSSTLNIHGLTAKTTPVDNDEFAIADSAASWILKKLSWANIKATLKSYFDTLYEPIGGGGGTPPLAANFTLFGPCTLTDKVGRLVVEATQQINEIQGGYQAVLSTPYTVGLTFTFSGMGGSGGGARAGICISDGTQYLVMYVGDAGGTRVIRLDYWSTDTSYGSTVMTEYDACVGGPLSLRITDDGSGLSDARKYWISGNGLDWVEIYHSANTATFTPTTCGFAVYDYPTTVEPAKMSIIDWVNTGSVLGDAA